ncbi:unnamed protein product [Amoebophrya sp. A120]|nr:unnamed protein product [Amoebophrya sp. A120]|eukprot:GSA120T00018133001.1
MFSVTSKLALATTSSLAVLSAAAPVFEDTPLTTELWALCSKNEDRTDEQMEAFLYQNPDLALARSADKRGGLWWAWEYKNSFALAALKAYGAEPLSTEEDDDGNTPQQMCSGEECANLLSSVADIEKGILDRKAEREKNDQAAMDEDEDDDDLDGDDEDTGRMMGSKGSATPPDSKIPDITTDDDEDEDL